MFHLDQWLECVRVGRNDKIGCQLGGTVNNADIDFAKIQIEKKRSRTIENYLKTSLT